MTDRTTMIIRLRKRFSDLKRTFTIESLHKNNPPPKLIREELFFGGQEMPISTIIIIALLNIGEFPQFNIHRFCTIDYLIA